ncbi:MAG TPA: flagellar type III secretion system pore protein FliP, partial [Acidimicrobiales bacterium]|nr:flagellar type III secretion system pore protein FliP [Acidimicrobiales bacterium]
MIHALITTAVSTTPTTTPNGGATLNINLGNSLSKPSDSILLIISLTLLALAPSLLILMTGFTRIIIVFSLLRQALGLSTTPPNQVLAGLALILSLFIMAPTISQVNKVAIQPYVHGKANASQAYHLAETPLKTWMLKQTGSQELALTTSVDNEHPA